MRGKGSTNSGPTDPVCHVQRAVVNFAGMILWFSAIAIVPLGKAVAIHFTLPLFVLVLAAIVLGEHVGKRRIAATVVGFAGMLVILRPGVSVIGWPEAMILASAVLYAATVIYLKAMVATETPLALTFYTNCLICLFCLPPAFLFWTPPVWDDWLPILALGLLGTFAPFLYTTALRGDGRECHCLPGLSATAFHSDTRVRAFCRSAGHLDLARRCHHRPEHLVYQQAGRRSHVLPMTFTLKTPETGRTDERSLPDPASPAGSIVVLRHHGRIFRYGDFCA